MMKFTVFFALFALGTLAGADSILRSNAALVLKDSYSSIPIANFTAVPSLTDALMTDVQGCFHSVFTKSGSKELLFTLYENFYSPFANTYPKAVTYDTSSGSLTEISRIHCAENVGQNNGVASPNPSRPYVASSTYQSIANIGSGRRYDSTASTSGLSSEDIYRKAMIERKRCESVAGCRMHANPYLPHIYLIEVYTYDQYGIFNQAPSTVFNMATLSPQIYNQTVAYNGLCGISSDGKYMIATYALGVGIPGFIVGQKYVILEAAADGSSLTPVATIDAAPTNINNLYSFCQGATMWPHKFYPNQYNIIIAENSWNLTYPLGLTAQVGYYTFNSASHALTRKTTEWVSQYIQGFDVDTHNNRVYALTNEVSSTGISINQSPRTPYNNPSVDKDSELYAWRLNELTGTLNYRGGINLNADGIQVRSSHDGKTLAVTTGSVISNDLFITNYTALGPVARRYAPNMVQTYSTYGLLDVWVKAESSSAASPLAFGLAFTEDDSKLVVVGQSTYRAMAPYVTGQKDTQLYDVVDQ